MMKLKTPMPDQTSTLHRTKSNGRGHVVGVEYAGEKPYSEASGLYDQHRKFTEQRNQWRPCQSAHDFQHIQSLSK
jgi:hypothetical protein